MILSHLHFIMTVWVYYVLVFYLSSTYGFSFTEEGQNLTSHLIDRMTGKDSDVFRQLLNQETIIRMSMVKNVHSLMQDMVSLKQDMASLQNTDVDLKREIEQLKLQKQQLAKENAELKQQLVIVNISFENVDKTFENVDKTFENVAINMSQIKDNFVQFERTIEQNRVIFEQNTSGILDDIKVEVRYMSHTLLNLKQHTLEIDRNIPKLLQETNHSIIDWTNSSLQKLGVDLKETNDRQLKIISSLSNLEIFQENITSVIHDDINTTLSDIQATVQQHTVDQSRLSSSVKSLQLEHLRKGVGFTAGTTSSKSSWTGSILVFEKVLYDVGGGYSSSTGIFTSPVDGNFVFYITIESYGSNYIYVDIVLNEDSKVRVMAYTPAHQGGTNMVLMRLQRGDKVWVRYYSGNGYYTDSIPMTTFSGFLIY